MYRCQLCTEKTPAGQSRITHIQYRKNRLTGMDEIANEIAICQHCKNMLDQKVYGDRGLTTLSNLHKSTRKVVETAKEYKLGEPREKYVPLMIPKELREQYEAIEENKRGNKKPKTPKLSRKAKTKLSMKLQLGEVKKYRDLKAK